MEKNEQIAIRFGKTLDKDQFELTKKLLSDDCKYFIGKDVLTGPDEICNSYEQNMIEGRNKLDNLVWGDSNIESINEKKFIVYFTDYLTHKNKRHVHRCKQALTFNSDGLIL
tara:strand:+ start:34372 stop:34707 length:336 start_codon:yes stop_codon:yes gene_type:complete